jgi:hypothetical protein
MDRLGIGREGDQILMTVWKEEGWLEMTSMRMSRKEALKAAWWLIKYSVLA